MSLLDVPDGRLYYELRGSGPLLLLIPGASGTADSFTALATHMAPHATVLSYDRRGYSRSALDGPQNPDRLGNDADDARCLIEQVGEAPADIFGASSGAIVALAVLTRHPDAARTVLAFEPPALRSLPDGQRWLDFFAGVYDRYRTAGIPAALQEFRDHTFAAADRQVMARAHESAAGHDGTRINLTHWFEHELRQYPAAPLDLPTLAGRADQLGLLAGRESRGYPAYEATLALSRRLRRTLTELPGGHLGHLTKPSEFSRALADILTSRRDR